MHRQRISHGDQPLGVMPELIEPLISPLPGFHQQLRSGVDHHQRQMVEQRIAGLLQAFGLQQGTLNAGLQAMPTLLQPVDQRMGFDFAGQQRRQGRQDR